MRTTTISRRSATVALLSFPLLGGWPGALHCALPPSLPASLSSLAPTVLPGGGQWESWTFPDDVDAAVRQLRDLIFQWPGSKIMSQSVDRRYMRVTFEQAELTGVYQLGCQFYVVPTGNTGGAAVVQCRRGRAAYPSIDPSGQDRERGLAGGLAGVDVAGFLDAQFTREQLRELRSALTWRLRASGSGDPSNSFQRLQSVFKKTPLGQVSELVLSDEQLQRLTENAVEFSVE